MVSMDFDKILKALEEAKAMLWRVGDPFRGQQISDAIFCMRQYVEPWMCPDCGHTVKIPPVSEKPRECEKCHREQVYPYSYLEQERMARQLKMLVQCVQHIAFKTEGEPKSRELAETTLLALEKGHSGRRTPA